MVERICFSSGVHPHRRVPLCIAAFPSEHTRSRRVQRGRFHKSAGPPVGHTSQRPGPVEQTCWFVFNPLHKCRQLGGSGPANSDSLSRVSWYLAEAGWRTEEQSRRSLASQLHWGHRPCAAVLHYEIYRKRPRRFFCRLTGLFHSFGGRLASAGSFIPRRTWSCWCDAPRHASGPKIKYEVEVLLGPGREQDWRHEKVL